ncbi:uncharacterized protein LAESUDRAFT_676534 [Laetiporus sulphureus 93-53]|uniref:F-box domain-containing protein n=1 Tax=Laetiporus sulphureus 93-53 TaxID=1314785 RepID=A0A165F5V4_9APHY|nr:uncharacterized protein LAESUDRAFT_676534 [Laetiporus sulphureus 93-53]KZT08449.1 hypothetical protein LAESUDRAFT_676534 [Laetiporus sulphureus 93-53]
MSARRQKRARASDTAMDGTTKESLAIQVAPRRALRGRRGGLKDLLEMPDDVLFEILKLLHPKGLLNLARATKPFHGFLMSRKSMHIWKSSRSLIDGLPDCPEHLSEPAYANLLFFSHCHRCLKGSINSVLWEFSVRYCKACKNDMAIPQREHSYTIAMLDRSLPSEIFNKVQFRSSGELYHRPQLECFVDAWNGLPKDEQSRQQLISKFSEKTRRIAEHAAACREWHEEQLSARATEFYEIRRERYEAIVARLRDDGWGDELDNGSFTLRLKLEKCDRSWIPRPLTERGWIKIRGALRACMQQERDARIERDAREQQERDARMQQERDARMQRERDVHTRVEHDLTITVRLCILQQVSNQLLSAPPWTAACAYRLLPHDLPYVPEIRALIEAPTSCSIPAYMFSSLRKIVLSHSMDWQQHATEQLINLLPGVSAAEGVDVLELAVVTFWCTECLQILFHRYVLAHICLRAERIGIEQDVFLDGRVVPPVWSASRVAASPNMHQLRALVEMCGWDPDSTTAQEMDEYDIRYACPCVDGRTMVMRWRKAVEITVGCGEGAPMPQFRLATAEEIEDAIQDEAHERWGLEAQTAEKPFWCCSQCTPRAEDFTTLQGVNEHYRQKHGGIALSTAEADMAYLHPSGGPIVPQPVTLPLLHEEPGENETAEGSSTH